MQHKSKNHFHLENRSARECKGAQGNARECKGMQGSARNVYPEMKSIKTNNTNIEGKLDKLIKFLTKSQKKGELHQNSRESCGVKPRN